MASLVAMSPGSLHCTACNIEKLGMRLHAWLQHANVHGRATMYMYMYGHHLVVNGNDSQQECMLLKFSGVKLNAFLLSNNILNLGK